MAKICRKGSIQFSFEGRENSDAEESNNFRKLESIFEQYMLVRTQDFNDLTFIIQDNKGFGYTININFDDKERMYIKMTKIGRSDTLKRLIQYGWKIDEYGSMNMTVSQKEFLSDKFTINFVQTLKVLLTRYIDYSM